MTLSDPKTASDATPATVFFGSERLPAFWDLANRLIAKEIPPNLSDDLVAAHAAGFDFLRGQPAGFTASFRGKSATGEPTLMGLFMGRPEAQRTAARVETDLMTELASFPGIAAESRQLLLRPEALLAVWSNFPGENLRGGQPGSQSKAGARLSGDSREIAQRFISQTKSFAVARASWEAVAHKIIPLFTLAELFQARLPWSALLTLPSNLVSALLDQAAQRQALWSDPLGHAPLGTLCEMGNGFLSRPERSALIAELLARKSPSMGSSQHNPYFTLANQVVNHENSHAPSRRHSGAPPPPARA